MWSDDWTFISIVFTYSPAIHKIIYTTNPIELLHYTFHKVTITWGSFTTDESDLKLPYLAIKKITKTDDANRRMDYDY